MSLKPRGRGPVVHLDRSQKAKMISEIVRFETGKHPVDLRVLDIGGGNGKIGEFFAQNNIVDSVDVEDRRPNEGKARFHLVDSELLPFADASFDLVISHHVIEHVQNQALHLSEMRRVMSPGACGYIATPNKSSPIMEGHVGNDMVLRWPNMIPLLESAGFSVSEYGWRVLTDPDRFHGEVGFGRFIPPIVARRLRRFYPSHMFCLRVNE